MTRTALCVALWTIACMAVTIVGFYFISTFVDGGNPFARGNPIWGALIFLVSFGPVAGIVAGLLWPMFHREGRKPGWVTYAVLAGLVVVISHILVFGVVGSIGSARPLRDLFGAIWLIVPHGWLGVPVALAGTALFVLWNRRRAAA